MQAFAAPVDAAAQCNGVSPYWNPNQAAAVRLLLSLGARVEAAATKGPLAGWTALHWAAARDHTPTALVLLELGASAGAADQLQRRYPYP